MSLYADPLNPTPPEHYDIDLTWDSIDLERVQGGDNRSLGEVDTQQLFHAAHVRVTILVDRDLRSVWLFVDGALVQRWIDPSRLMGDGTGLLFQPLGDFQDVALSKIRVTAWDGRVHE